MNEDELKEMTKVMDTITKVKFDRTVKNIDVKNTYDGIVVTITFGNKDC